jgi:hypothetical protein
MPISRAPLKPDHARRAIARARSSGSEACGFSGFNGFATATRANLSEGEDKSNGVTNLNPFNPLNPHQDTSSRNQRGRALSVSSTLQSLQPAAMVPRCEEPFATDW